MSHHRLQLVNDNYSMWGDQQLADDLSTFFCTNRRTMRLWKQLADRIGNTQRASKETKSATEKSFIEWDALALFWTFGSQNEGMWHNAHMQTSGTTWFNGAVEPLEQMMNLDCAS